MKALVKSLVLFLSLACCSLNMNAQQYVGTISYNCVVCGGRCGICVNNFILIHVQFMKIRVQKDHS